MMIHNLTLIEDEIYDFLSHNFLNKSKELKIQEILPKCINLYGERYTQEQISNAIQSLFEKRYLIRGSTLTRDNLFQNSLRKQILQFIQINPGCYNRLIRRRLKIGSNEFNWHIRILEKFGLVKKCAYDHSFGYYENRDYMDHEFDLFLLQNEKVLKILNLLKRKPESLSHIAGGLKMHYSTAQKYLTLLVKQGILFKNTSSNHQLYEINEERMMKLQKIINGGIFIEYA